MTRSDEHRDHLHAVRAGSDPAPALTARQVQLATVPPEWAQPMYPIDADPYRQVFTQNLAYAPGRVFDFGPLGQDLMRAETAWWIWTCWREGLRKIEPSMLRWT